MRRRALGMVKSFSAPDMAALRPTVDMRHERRVARRQLLRALIGRSMTQRRVDATARHTATGPVARVEQNGIVTLVAERLGAGQACHSQTDNSAPHDIPPSRRAATELTADRRTSNARLVD